MAQRQTSAKSKARSASGRTEAVREVVQPVLADLGLDLEGLRLQRAGSRTLLRILVDCDGGVTLDDAAEAARRLSDVLDGSAVMGEQAYLLDVGSPGVDRELTLLRHWRRNAGRLVRITMSDGSVMMGRIAAASGPADDGPPDTVTIGTDDGDVFLAVQQLQQVRRAVVQVEFGEMQAEE